MTKEGSMITPATTPDVNFNDQLTTVQTNITDRVTTRHKLTTQWNKLREEFSRYGVKVQVRRQEEAPSHLIDQVTVVTDPPKPRDTTAQQIKAKGGDYQLYQLYRDNPDTVDLINEQFKGFDKLVKQVAQIYRQPKVDKVLDEKATAKARESLIKLCTAYDETCAELDEQNETIGGVREYIDVVEKLASISSTAGGSKKGA